MHFGISPPQFRYCSYLLVNGAPPPSRRPLPRQCTELFKAGAVIARNGLSRVGGAVVPLLPPATTVIHLMPRGTVPRTRAGTGRGGGGHSARASSPPVFQELHPSPVSRKPTSCTTPALSAGSDHHRSIRPTAVRSHEGSMIGLPVHVGFGFTPNPVAKFKKCCTVERFNRKRTSKLLKLFQPTRCMGTAPRAVTPERLSELVGRNYISH